MREIKFRAWDGEAMWDVREMTWDAGGVASLYLGLHSQDMTDEIKLMQFTGLHDKNGREIYEGDVVRTSEYEKPHQIAFGGGKFYLDIDMEDDSLTTPHWIEVIGNIYENPELLK